ncbi:hypothetical protein FRC04_001350 [Tulasnella sp. 424]|nr:hypothetical protein FRC04_001350 [Tulasnella sp. 424]
MADPTTSIAKALQAKAHAFNKLLNQPRLSTKFRTQADVEDGLKKLRRLILVEGIPFTVVSALRVVGIDVVWCGKLIDFGSDFETEDMETLAWSDGEHVFGYVFEVCCEGPLCGSGEDPE